MANCVTCGSNPCVCDDEFIDIEQGYSLSTCGQGCPPSQATSSCVPACDPANEPLASALNNFITAFFGTFTKVCENGQIVWIEPCNLEQGVQGIPRIPGEGVACYLLRVYDTLLRMCTIDFRKIWINAECYDTWQEAYDAHQADAVPVMMLIGQGSFGDLTLTADYNPNIIIVGFGPTASVLGDVHAETATGAGYSVAITAKDVTIGNITTKTTSAVFPDPGTSAGLIRLTVEGQVVVGNLDSSAEFGGNSAGTVVVTGTGKLIGGDIYTPSLNFSGNVFLGEYANVGNITTGKNTSLFAGVVNLNRFCQTLDISALADPAAGSGGGISLSDECSVGNIDTTALNSGGIIITNKCSLGDIYAGNGSVTIADDCIVSSINSSSQIGIGDRSTQGGNLTSTGDIRIGVYSQFSNLTTTGGIVSIGNLSVVGNITSSGNNVTIGDSCTVGNVDASNGAGAGGNVSIGSSSAVSAINTTGTVSSGNVTLKTGSSCDSISFGANGGIVSSNSATINSTVDLVLTGTLFRNTVFTTSGGDCVADLGSDGVQFQNCLFVPSGGGECINSTTPKTIDCYNGLGLKPLPANVSLNEGNYLDSPNLIAP